MPRSAVREWRRVRARMRYVLRLRVGSALLAVAKGCQILAARLANWCRNLPKRCEGTRLEVYALKIVAFLSWRPLEMAHTAWWLYGILFPIVTLLVTYTANFGQQSRRPDIVTIGQELPQGRNTAPPGTSDEAAAIPERTSPLADTDTVQRQQDELAQPRPDPGTPNLSSDSLAALLFQPSGVFATPIQMPHVASREADIARARWNAPATSPNLKGPAQQAMRLDEQAVPETNVVGRGKRKSDVEISNRPPSRIDLRTRRAGRTVHRPPIRFAKLENCKKFLGPGYVEYTPVCR